MKTKTQITELIQSEEKYLSDNLKTLTDKQFATIQNKIDFYKYILKYLELSPSDEFCNSELSRLKDQSDKINSRYTYWLNNIAPKNVDPKTFRALFNRETNLTKVNKQLKTLKFIVEDQLPKQRKSAKPKK